MDRKIDCLDQGYVRLVDKLGNDLTVVNAARVSYQKEKQAFDSKDERLLKFLVREGHWSPFRQAALQFEVYAPLMVARQWYKYAVASSHIDDQNGWNESSRRYVTEEPTFYNPGVFGWRTAPENSKQGSGPPMDTRLAAIATDELDAYIKQGVDLYEKWQKIGMAAEQARLFLPSYGMYVRWRWTPSLAAVIHFLKERLEHDAQKEIQVFAQAVDQLVRDEFPQTWKAVFE